MVSPKVLWPDEHIEALREYLAGNAGSQAWIARRINERFGSVYSRNAIIGKAGRLGLSTGRAPKPKAPKVERPPPARKPQPSIAQAVALRCVEVEPLNLSLIDLEPEHCRWPYGDGPFTFCGHPVFEGCYCGPHFYLSCRAA